MNTHNIGFGGEIRKMIFSYAHLSESLFHTQHASINYNCIMNAVCRSDVILISKIKPVLSGHSKIDQTKVLKTDGSLMHVESIAECSLGAFCNTFDLY